MAHRSFLRRGLKNSKTRPRARKVPVPFGRRMWFEVLEERVLLASDLDVGLQNIVKAGAANAFSLVDTIHDRIFDRVLQRTQPLIGNALQVKDTVNDKLNVLSTT